MLKAIYQQCLSVMLYMTNLFTVDERRVVKASKQRLLSLQAADDVLAGVTRSIVRVVNQLA